MSTTYTDNPTPINTRTIKYFNLTVEIRDPNTIMHKFNAFTSVEVTRTTSPHAGIACNSCNTQNFSGPRYKCIFCVDFDLCDQCEHKHRTTKFHCDGKHMFLQML